MNADKLWQLAQDRKDYLEDVQGEIQEEIEDLEQEEDDTDDEYEKNRCYEERMELEHEFDSVTRFIDDCQDVIYLTDGSEDDEKAKGAGLYI